MRNCMLPPPYLALTCRKGAEAVERGSRGKVPGSCSMRRGITRLGRLLQFTATARVLDAIRAVRALQVCTYGGPELVHVVTSREDET